jgi:hypothetical protein
MHGETKLQDAIQILETHYCMKIKMLEFLACYSTVSKANSCALPHKNCRFFTGFFNYQR